MSAYTSVDMILSALELETDDRETTEQIGSLIVRVSALEDRVLGFSFNGPATTRTIDGSGDSRLLLPAPGAIVVSSVVENGVALVPGEYELQARTGQYLIRLDVSNYATPWTSQPRGVVVVYTPNPAPPEIEELTIVEVVRRWQGKAGGYQETTGVQGSTERRVMRAFAPGALDMLSQIRADYGVRNLVAV